MDIRLSRVPDFLRIEPGSPCLGHLKKIANCKTLRDFPPHHTIFSQGESPHTVGFICEGVVKLTRTESNGKRVIVGLRRAGWMLGAAASLIGVPYVSTAETVCRSKLCMVPIEQFQQLMRTNELFSQWISLIFSREVYVSLQSFGEKWCLSGRQRLEKFLRETIEGQDGVEKKGPARIQMMLKNWEVAQLLAITPQHLSRLISQLEGEGVLLRKKGWLILPNPKKLFRPGISSPASSIS